LELHAAIHPDVTAVLDYPLDPRATASTNRRRWIKTLRSAEFMRRHSNGIVLAPVLHAYSARTATARLDELKAIFPKPPFWCLGSLVPLFHGSHIGSRFATQTDTLSRLQRRWHLIADLIRQIRPTIGDSVLHVFGAGSLSTIFLLFLAGADSVDSAAWRLKAAYGAIQLPGLGDRFLATKADHSRVRKVLTANCREILSRCACPVCEDLTLEKRVAQLFRHFEARATHNAYVLVSEVTALRRAKRLGKIADFVLNRLVSIPAYRNVAETVVLPLVS
jgi:queuine/archaeosine tRNA-ribosyltransferase